MTIIEIWGFYEFGSWGAADFHKRIVTLFAGKPFYDDMRISHVWSLVYNRSRGNKPHLRVFSSDSDEVEGVCNILRMNGFDVVQPLVLISFTKSAMWVEKEIKEDLTAIQQGKVGPASLVGTDTNYAQEDLESHLYANVAEYYRRAVNEMRKLLVDPSWVPTVDDLANKANVSVSGLRGEDATRARIAKITQIINSLQPVEPLESE